MKKKQQFPPGWDEKRVKEVIAHHENQSEDEEAEEIEAALKAENTTLMDIPTELVNMPSIKRRLKKDEFAERGDNIYETIVRPLLKPSDEGRFAAIDIDSGEYEVDADEMAAGAKLRSRLPKSQIWMVRIGSRSVHRFGGRIRRDTP